LRKYWQLAGSATPLSIPSAVWSHKSGVTGVVMVEIVLVLVVLVIELVVS
jgi:hypothetical protein